MPKKTMPLIHDSFHTRTELTTVGGPAVYYRLSALSEQGVADIERLPCATKILLEALLRCEDGQTVSRDDILRLARWNPAKPAAIEIPFKPCRVLLQDFTGVPCVVDMAAMRSAVHRLGGDPQLINPRIPVDLVVDHSVQVDAYNTPDALERNTRCEFERNRERYELFRWAQQAFANLRIIPPATGICHQVNLEYLATVVACRKSDGVPIMFPDSVVGTDSHTTMINGLGVAGWGIGGIEAEAVILGEPLYMAVPPVVGMRLHGRLREGVSATDLVLTITQLLRERGVVGNVVEFFGSGLSAISVPDRATIANMAPEYGATMGYFPVDSLTLDFLRSTGRSDELVTLVEQYCRVQGIFRTDSTPDPVFQDIVELDLAAVGPCMAGPRRPQDRIALSNLKTRWRGTPNGSGNSQQSPPTAAREAQITLDDSTPCTLRDGSVVIAAISSCTNTSNPSAMLGAGLLAKKAVTAGLATKPWVKTSLAPGSVAVTAYLQKTGLLPFLERLGFHVVGYGCATCIGNSGPLPAPIERAIETHNLTVAAVVSGNRNFEGRIHPLVRANFLASPAMVVACALTGTIACNFEVEPVGCSPEGKPVFLRDLLPRSEEINALLDAALSAELFHNAYADIERANPYWNAIPITEGLLYGWNDQSTYIKEPPYFLAMESAAGPIQPIAGARVLVLLGDSVTTDHISPAGTIRPDSPAGRYLSDRGVAPSEFNSYGSRRGNHEVMVRGTFANIRLRNLLAPDTEGGITVCPTGGDLMNIYDAAVAYQQQGIPTIVIAGRDYGMGSSRDWAAKGTRLLGVRAVLAQSFERIHRSNLAGMGVLPLQFKNGQNARTLGLTGRETYTVMIDDSLQPGQDVLIEAAGDSGIQRLTAVCRLDTRTEIDYYRNGGILPRVLRAFLK